MSRTARGYKMKPRPSRSCLVDMPIRCYQFRHSLTADRDYALVHRPVVSVEAEGIQILSDCGALIFGELVELAGLDID